IRPKIHRLWNDYLKPFSNAAALVGLPTAMPPIVPLDPDALLEQIDAHGAAVVPDYRGGTREAMRRLDRFVHERLPRYATERNQPIACAGSELSAHLHFDQISPVTIALNVMNSGAPSECIDMYLEELIVRRELAINFVTRNNKYDSLAGCPEWA